MSHAGFRKANIIFDVLWVMALCKVKYNPPFCV